MIHTPKSVFLILLTSFVLPLIVLAQILAPGPVKVLTPDEFLQTFSSTKSYAQVTEIAQSILRDLGRRFQASRGQEIVNDINAKTGIDLEKFFGFVIQILVYLFTQIYAVVVDIATKFGTP